MGQSNCRSCHKNMGANPDENLFCSASCNPAARKAYGRRYSAARVAKGLRGRKLHQHGMSDEEWMVFSAEQKCHACGTTDPAHARGFMVDHDHLCCPGNFGCPACVRGLLCHGCNIALGAIKDDANRLLDLYAYLYRDQGMPVPKPQEALNG